MNDIAYLKDQIPIESVVEAIGGSVHAGWAVWARTNCPFHDDRVASASTHRALGKFICHACNIRGDIIDLARIHLHDSDIPTAMRWLEDQFLGGSA